MTGQFFVARAQCPRYQSPRSNRHADTERAGEEQDRTGIADGGGKLCLAQHRDENHVDKVDKKDRHQPHRRGERHD